MMNGEKSRENGCAGTDKYFLESNSDKNPESLELSRFSGLLYI